ncbi:tyrosine-type recombinase/integrase [Streptomyces sp. NPDC058239]|uniref:tyrosine-type recombinase/integrase n=1 Tax=unclassified Streptomyces TaxID=2593676 RepID=UPI00364D4572
MPRSRSGSDEPVEELRNALAATGLTNADGEALTFSPHDFRRIFVTDAIMNGLPPHIAQVICEHKRIDTTMGYKAVYPAETIEAHRAFIARRRTSHPSEEYRTPTEEELGCLPRPLREKEGVHRHLRTRLQNRTPCIHEHACVRCSLLRPDPAQRTRLADIRDNLIARIAEAEREGWLGEVEGLRVGLTGAEEKIAQFDARQERRSPKVLLGVPSFDQIGARSAVSPDHESTPGA